MKNSKIYVGATVGLILGVTAFAPVLPIVNGVANVYAAEGSSVEVATYTGLVDAISDSSISTVVLTGDISGITDVIAIPVGRTVTIDLNNHHMMVRESEERGISNRGDLTIKNGEISNGDSSNDSYGIIDNFGTLTLSNVNIKEHGANMGSSVRNFGTAYINSDVKIESLTEEAGNVGVYACKGDTFIADGAEITSVSRSYYPVQVGRGNLTIGTVGSENPAKINGSAAGIYVFGNGKLTINNAIIESERKQSIRVDTDSADVVINGGKFSAPYGGVYIYTSEAGAAPLVTINDGEFSGQYASVVSTNRAGSLEAWAFDIKGGVFAGTRIREYLADNYGAYKIANYFENGWNGYKVDTYEASNIPTTIYVKKGTQAAFGISDAALKYANITMDRNDVIILDRQEITSGKTGIVKITTELNDGSDPIVTTVYSYENLFSAEIVDGSSFDAADIAALDRALGAGEKKIGYIDVTYARVINGEEIGRITEVDEPVTVLVELPELSAVPDGYKRSYRLLQYLNGRVVEVEDAIINADELTLGFETKTFSPFLVTYTDTLIPVEEEPEEPKEDPKDEPNHPVIPKDDTFDFDDPGELDPLGETHTQPAKVSPAANASRAAKADTPSVPNTSNVQESSEINLMIAMMLGSVSMTAVVLGAKKAYRKR
ncbi:hypothetical protein IKG48_01975 [Candidatus Saccharibacteria bacterium]|nr:hypothetical protein [Candidatus Saccharibacteria bacterium]